MGRAGDEVGALGEGLLEVRAEQAEHVGRVVEDDGVDALLGEEPPDLGDRLAMQHHAAPEDDELGPVAGDELLAWRARRPGRGCRRASAKFTTAGASVRGSRATKSRSAPMGWALRCPPLPMWLFMTMRMRRGSALGSARLAYSTRALNTAMLAIWPLSEAGLGLGAAEVRGELGLEAALDRGDEPGALVVEELVVVEGLGAAVLGVAKRGVHDRGQAHERRGRHLRGDQVHAARACRQAVLAIVSRSSSRALPSGVAARQLDAPAARGRRRSAGRSGGASLRRWKGTTRPGTCVPRMSTVTASSFDDVAVEVGAGRSSAGRARRSGASRGPRRRTIQYGTEVPLVT